MDALDLARWQFGITTVYHFLFVPLTIGMATLVAAMETAWLRTRDPRWLRATKFWGKLFLINFAMGVVTGIVQEFQFGMNWSSYSRFVGDVFGAPLAMEALLAFFLESTFLGLWIFGWSRLPGWLHAACMWVVAAGTMLSAYFILAANSWMQHPVGYQIVDGRAQLTDIWAVLTNTTQLATFPHTLFACFLTAGVFLLAISCWTLARRRHVEVMRPSLRLGLWVTLIASIGLVVTGDIQARVMTDQQPMKMAAAEALYETSEPASFSVLTIGRLDGSEELWSLRIPRLALARALLADVPVLLCDEPDSSLDPILADRLVADLLAAASDRSVIIVTHQLGRLADVDEVIVLDQGRVAARGRLDQLRGDPALVPLH